MGRVRGYPIPDGYEDETINLNPSGYENMLGRESG